MHKKILDSYLHTLCWQGCIMWTNILANIVYYTFFRVYCRTERNGTEQNRNCTRVKQTTLKKSLFRWKIKYGNPFFLTCINFELHLRYGAHVESLRVWMATDIGMANEISETSASYTKSRLNQVRYLIEIELQEMSIPWLHRRLIINNIN